MMDSWPNVANLINFGSFMNPSKKSNRRPPVSRSHTVIWRDFHERVHPATATKEEVMSIFPLMAAGTITEESCRQNRITNTL